MKFLEAVILYYTIIQFEKEVELPDNVYFDHYSLLQAVGNWIGKYWGCEDYEKRKEELLISVKEDIRRQASGL